MTKCYLLRHGPYELPEGSDPVAWGESIKSDYQHFAGCPTYGPNTGNLDLARTFKTEASARATNEFRYYGYEIVEAVINIELAVKRWDIVR